MYGMIFLRAVDSTLLELGEIGIFLLILFYDMGDYD